MDQKGWMGAELIFDLDADHLANADKMTYDEMLVQIRSEMISLVDDYIMGDLGFSEDQVHISFSGGRGYLERTFCLYAPFPCDYTGFTV